MQKRHYLTGAIEILAFVLLIVLIVLFSHLYDEFPYETGSGLWTDRKYFIIVFLSLIHI